MSSCKELQYVSFIYEKLPISSKTIQRYLLYNIIKKYPPTVIIDKFTTTCVNRAELIRYKKNVIYFPTDFYAQYSINNIIDNIYTLVFGTCTFVSRKHGSSHVPSFMQIISDMDILLESIKR